MKTNCFLIANLLLAAALLCPNLLEAQGIVMHVNSDGSPSITQRNSKKYKEIGRQYLECRYETYHLTDTTVKVDLAGKVFEGDTLKAAAENSFTGGWIARDLMVLQIGKSLSKYFSYYKFHEDSLMSAMSMEQLRNFDYGSVKTGTTECVFKNYPEGKVTTTENVAVDRFKIEEPAIDFGWEIGDQTKEILGYQCQKAICSFRGRDYIAWFAPDIAVSEGPWKFGGLPGLIMEAYDSRNQYHFIIAGIRKVDDQPIKFLESQYIDTSRTKYQKTLSRYLEDPIGYINNNTNIKIQISSPSGSESDAMKPKDLKYDQMERDY
jgi:GLPGLI family protein